MSSKFTQIGIIYDHKVNMCKILFNNGCKLKDVIDNKMFISSPEGKISVKKLDFIYHIQFSEDKFDRRLYGIVRDEWDCIMNGVLVYLHTDK